MKKKDTSEREIFSHIKQSLEGYEETYIPGSWESFLQKRRIRQRKLFLRIASGIAACLLVGYAGSNYIIFDNRDYLSPTIDQTTRIDRNTPEIKLNSTIKSQPSVATFLSDSKLSKSAVAASKANLLPKENLVAEREDYGAEHPVVSIPGADTAHKIAAFATSIGRQAIGTNTDSVKSSLDTIIGYKTNIFQVAPAPKKNQDLAVVSNRKVRFGLNFSPGLSTAQASSSFNYTGGISADIPLSSKILISTGLQVENQSLARKFQSIVSSSTAPQNETKTKLINLDLPVNITWKFAPGKSHGYYVSAGISSLVYLRQDNKNTTYSQMLVPVSSIVAGNEIKSYNVVDQVSVSHDQVPPAQTFDFAGRINMIVGFEKKLSNRIFIHFEPYAKIPVSGLAPGEVNHTTTGINFKISF
ncbi:MAG: PorT family protein [Prolixibacteraceae bacterium]|jgi:hypothetical protein|nr:PorT family protein [Prolixibacteraceae bacterium]